MDNTVKKRSLDDIISATERIIKSKENDQVIDLFGETKNSKVLSEIDELLGLQSTDQHDSDLAHKLYYGVLKKLILTQIPQIHIRRLIQLLICNLLTDKELLSQNEYRGSDSRQQPTDKLNEVAEIIVDWSAMPYDYMKLAQTLLDKCKEKGISPQNRELRDFNIK